jgi:hypothetical protein
MQDFEGRVAVVIRNEQFWVTTTNDFDGAVRARMAGILDRRNPEMPPLP